jgi:hypothetical protein
MFKFVRADRRAFSRGRSRRAGQAIKLHRVVATVGTFREVVLCKGGALQAVAPPGAVILIPQSREKNLGSCRINQLQRSFVVPQGGTPQDDNLQRFSAACLDQATDGWRIGADGCCRHVCAFPTMGAYIATKGVATYAPPARAFLEPSGVAQTCALFRSVAMGSRPAKSDENRILEPAALPVRG